MGQHAGTVDAINGIWHRAIEWPIHYPTAATTPTCVDVNLEPVLLSLEGRAVMPLVMPNRNCLTLNLRSSLRRNYIGAGIRDRRVETKSKRRASCQSGGVESVTNRRPQIVYRNGPIRNLIAPNKELERGRYPSKAEFRLGVTPPQGGFLCKSDAYRCQFSTNSAAIRETARERPRINVASYLVISDPESCEHLSSQALCCVASKADRHINAAAQI